MASFIDLTGKQLGSLTVDKISEFKGNGKKPAVYWECTCECGCETIVNSNSLRFGRTKSCGCGMKASRLKHGMSRTREYSVWSGMKGRILNPGAKNKRLYVDRGIDIDPRWVDSFECFYQDMGSPPSSKHSIERIDNNRGYWANNCKWATLSEQNRNRRINKLITYKDKTQCIAAWAEETGIDFEVIRQRLKFWSVEKTLTTPVNKKLLILNGKAQCVADWARELGIDGRTLRQRLVRGWSDERTLTTPAIADPKLRHQLGITNHS